MIRKDNVKYRIKEAFRTVQGEGYHAGTPALFVRFAGCNLWSGLEDGRANGKGGCSMWCDTDFVGTDGDNGGVYTETELCELMATLCTGIDLIVLTGGEPSLQLNKGSLIERARRRLPDGVKFAIETNGTVRLPHGIDWVCVSPKPPTRSIGELRVQRANEVKVVYSGDERTVDPRAFADLAEHRYIQPLDPAKCKTDYATDKQGIVDACFRFVSKSRAWKLSTQTHKYLGLP